MQREIVGANEKELIIVADTTSNLHSLLLAFYQPQGKKTKILVDSHIFSSDRYAIEAQIELKSYSIEENLLLIDYESDYTIDEDKIISAMTEEVALILLPSVIHSTGQLLDMERLTREANSRKIPIGFDCSHSVGVVAHKLHEWEVDFSVWCNYKYLNGGLGCPASIFLHEKHFNMKSPLPGWHGYVKEKQFQKLPHFEQALGAGGWQKGSPFILNMAPLEGSMEMINEIDIEKLRDKSIKLTEYFIQLAKERLTALGFKILLADDYRRRGSHLALLHPASNEIGEFMDRGSNFTEDLKARISEIKKDEEVSLDNLIRIPLSPLFMGYEDVWNIVENFYKLLT